MKEQKMKKFVIMMAAITLTALAAQAGEGKHLNPNAPGPRTGQMRDQVLPPRVVDQLNLTADQKTKLDALNASFKKDVDAWEQAHPNFKDEVQKAREAKDKETMKKLMEERKPVFEARKKYIEEFKATLTDEQKKTLGEMKSTAMKHHGAKPSAPAPSEQ
jgi:Spy/CpxP family protein refolding chaperone